MLVEAIFAVREQVEKQREDRKSEENRKRGSAMPVHTYLIYSGSSETFINLCKTH